MFNIIGATNKFYVEIGFNADDWTMGSNTYNLNMNHGWKGVMFDGLHENEKINLYKKFISPETLVQTFQEHNVPVEVDYVSIDIDSQDLWVLQALIGPQSPYRPRVISVEYNAHFPLAATVTMPPRLNAALDEGGGSSGHGDSHRGRMYEPGVELDHYSWDGFDLYYGASAGALRVVANNGGYEVVQLVGFLDMILVRRDLLKV